ncbi:MAG TPA: TrkA family potassium uptake protein [Desulfobacterales bacterium]|nr:TrkA family potassium uptake protein [Desulfobacterales bacterium]
MNNFVQVGVIGLGKFGLEFGRQLAAQGVNVLGIDNREANIKEARHVFTQVYKANATQKEALLQMGMGDLSHVLVSVGDSIAASAMISMYLKELGVPVVWVKAINQDHAKLLKKVGVDDVFMPERMAARQLANRITIPGFIDYFPFNEEIVVKEIKINSWAGRSLRELNLTNKYRIQVIAVKKNQAKDYVLVPQADEKLAVDDLLVVIGEINSLAQIEP